MKNPRNVVVKALFNAEEFMALDDACGSADVPHSRLLRDLALAWVKQRQSTGVADQEKWASAGQKMAIPNAHSRVNFGIAPVRLRV
jgi:hypothetical protein